MLALAIDESVSGAIVRGLLRRVESVDLLRVQDAGLHGADDSAILAWAATQHRIVVTQDRKTFGLHAYSRVEQGLAMLGVFMLRSELTAGKAIEELELAIICSEPR